MILLFLMENHIRLVILSSRGFIELTLTLQGWLVTSSFGVSYKVQEII